MDRAKIEIAAIEETVAEATEAQVCELNDLQLALIGGGCADPILH
jgi:hypothetical protein